MSQRPDIVLHRNNPNRDPLVGHVKVTAEDWLNAARHILVENGAGDVKILTLAGHLGVSRSSFYWYFESRKDLLDRLLDDWETRNIASIVHHCERPADTITGAVCNFFRCFVNPDLFDPKLDFAVREWSRRDAAVRTRVDLADGARLTAVAGMFRRFGYDDASVHTRARVLYFMQLGYHALDVTETLDYRMQWVAKYLEVFTGQPAKPEEIEGLRAYLSRL